ncbi:MAG TPA: hypothetical protein VGX92_06870 [Pyrinomonadaceae bacterium]|jgi:hypothetical protein|nr:hypothetical protein [Pyrinomonadaceae bacterium]
MPERSGITLSSGVSKRLGRWKWEAIKLFAGLYWATILIRC